MLAVLINAILIYDLTKYICNIIQRNILKSCLYVQAHIFHNVENSVRKHSQVIMLIHINQYVAASNNYLSKGLRLIGCAPGGMRQPKQPIIYMQVEVCAGGMRRYILMEGVLWPTARTVTYD